MIKIKKMDQSILDEIYFSYVSDYRVAGMGEPWSQKILTTLQLLKINGISSILTLTEDDLYRNSYISANFLHMHEPIDDCEAPDTEGMDRALTFIDYCLQKNLSVAVHCFEGRGRTGTVLAAWLGVKESIDAKNAINRIHELRPHTILTPTQRSFLYHYLNKKIL